ncbi:MAG TPA: hypothetical protein PKY08_03285 [Candidatus Magasanikbacteria bacterium]|nr:hypothetical protein [Candidatus Magasanikbacteria bacterium]
MDSSLKRIINLIKKTGDRFIVTETDGDLSYVVLSLDDYEKLLSVKKESQPQLETKASDENQLLEKINQDIAMWQSQQKKIAENLESFRPEEKKESLVTEEINDLNIEKTSKEEEVGEKTEDQYYFEPLEP